MSRDEAIEVAKKLKALAISATGGERDAALTKLHQFCIKHDLDEADYATELIDVGITYENEQERLILSNVLCLIMETDQVKGKIKDHMYLFKCTPKQFDNIKDAFAHYKKEYYEYVDALLIALVSKNQVCNTKKSTEKPFRFDDEPESTQGYSEPVPEQPPDEPIEPGIEEELNQESTSPKSGPLKSHADVIAEEQRKMERVKRIYAVMEQNQWKPKVVPKYFLT